MSTSKPATTVIQEGLSFLDGGLTDTVLPAKMHLGDALVQAARISPTKGIYYLRRDRSETKFQNYGELLKEAETIAANLQLRGTNPGEKLIFQFEDNSDFIPAFWACVLGGHVPVPISISPTYEHPHNILSKLKNSWSMLGKPLVLTSAKLLPRLKDWAAKEGLDNFRVASIDALRTNSTNFAPPTVRQDDVALLLLTSGSTGLPKAVQQTHANLLRWGRSAARACDFSARDVSLNWMPLDHVGGLVMFHVRDVIVGCTQLHAPTEAVLQRPLAWLDWVHEYRVTITWAPNFAFGLINEQADNISAAKWDLSCLTFILNGGEAVVARTARKFLELLIPFGLPPHAMRPAWGMSETCSGVTYSNRFLLGNTSDENALVEVGEPIGGIQIRIVDQNDALVPAGRVGRLQIHGVSITPGYLDHPEANQKSFTRDGWFVTGDLGIIEDGQLTISGREKDVIIINGVNFYSHEIEAAVEQIPGVDVSYTAACAIRQAGENTDRLAVFFCPIEAAAERVAALSKTIRATVAQKEGVVPDFVVPLGRAEVPKTAIGKIQRALLRERFERGEFLSQPTENRSSPIATKVWIPIPVANQGLSSAARVLYFKDGSATGDAMLARLKESGARVFTVIAGDTYNQADQENYTINPFCREDYTALVNSISATCSHPTHILHSWAYGSIGEINHNTIDDAQAYGSLSLLRLLRSSAPWYDGDFSIKLLVVTTGLQPCAPEDSVEFIKAPILGIVRTAVHEFSGLKCTSLDLEPKNSIEHITQILGELAADTIEGEFAIREGVRQSPALEIPASSDIAPVSPFKREGLYLITGGLGGIGQALASKLSTAYSAKVLLLGRGQLHDHSNERQSAFRSLQAAGDVRYIAATLKDPIQTKELIDRSAAEFNRPIDAIFHLAGEYHEEGIRKETDEAFFGSVAAKLRTAYCFHHYALANPDCYQVYFSSILAHFGAMNNAAYTAANASLDLFAHHQRTLGIKSISLQWSVWTGIGMGKRFNSAELLSVRGYLTFDADRGWAALKDSLSYDRSPLLVGIDSSNTQIRRLFKITEATQTLTAFIEPRSSTEKKLAEIWALAMKRPKIGATDNFFELGGRSIVAAQIFARIEKVFGRSLPLATFFRAPTIEQLAILIDAAPNVAAACRKETLQANGSELPFFCIPGGAADVIVFRPLSEQLGNDLPFYGLQGHGLDGVKTDAPIIPIKDLATEFITEIKRAQPTGPYRIAGHCFGALLAYEVAQQLTAGGETISFLAMLDPTANEKLEVGPFRALRSRLMYQLRKCIQQGPIEQIRFLITRIRAFNHTLVVSHRMKHTLDRLRVLHEGYSIKKYPGEIHLFLATDSRFGADGSNDERLTWKKWADTVRVHHVIGNHHTILQGAEVKHLGDALRPFLLSGKNNRIVSLREETVA